MVLFGWASVPKVLPDPFITIDTINPKDMEERVATIYIRILSGGLPSFTVNRDK